MNIVLECAKIINKYSINSDFVLGSDTCLAL